MKASFALLASLIGAVAANTVPVLQRSEETVRTTHPFFPTSKHSSFSINVDREA